MERGTEEGRKKGKSGGGREERLHYSESQAVHLQDRDNINS